MPAIPLEILLLILDELPKSSLLSFGRTSKWAWAIAEPLLYRSITFQFLRYDYTNYHRGAPTLPAEHPVHSFFRAIRRRPARASYVKAATFLTNTDSYPHPAYSRFFDCPAPPDVKPLWLEASATLEHDFTPWMMSMFRDEVDGGHPTVLVASLLACLPELETLVADFTLQDYAKIGHLLMLKEVTIRNDLNWVIGRSRYRTQEVLSLVCLPRLEHLSAVVGGIDGDEITHANLPALRTLKITDSTSLDPSATRELLAGTPKLERLSYFLAEDTDALFIDENDLDDVNETAHQDEWSIFSTSLESVAGSLRILKISTDVTPSDFESEEIFQSEWLHGVSTRRGTVGSLRHLHNLTKLEIPIQVLVGLYPHRVKLRKILPPGLEKLYLRDDYPPKRREGDRSVEGLIEDLRSYLLEPAPSHEVLSLQEVRIKFRTWYLPNYLKPVRQEQELDEQHPFRRLENIARQAKVKCTIHIRVWAGPIMSWECMDEVDEVVVYDPSAVCPCDGTMESTMEPTRYLTRRRLKKARCFYSRF